jgi:hypothetical protein
MQPNTGSLYNDPALASAQSAVTSAQADYTDAAATQATLPDMLKTALMAKFTADNPMIKDLNNASTNFKNTVTSAPLSVMAPNNGGYIWSPNQQSDIINKTTNAALSPIAYLNDLISLSTGGISNMVTSAGNAYGAQVLKKKGAVDSAQTTLSNLMDLLKAKQSEKEFNITNGSGTTTDLLSTLVDLISGKSSTNGYTPTEAKPTYFPGQGKNIVGGAAPKDILYHSPDGQWIYDWDSQDWVPVVD